MSIIPTPVPDSAIRALETDIGAFIEKPSRVANAFLALPMFVVDQQEGLDVERLGASLQPDAWRFVMSVDGDEMAIMDVARETVAYSLAAVSEDTARAKELLRLVNRACAALPWEAEDEVELRLFEAPSFHIRAVWLHDRSRRHSDYFLMFDRRGRWPEELLTANQFKILFDHARLAKLGPRGVVDYDEPESA